MIIDYVCLENNECVYCMYGIVHTIHTVHLCTYLHTSDTSPELVQYIIQRIRAPAGTIRAQNSFFVWVALAK